MRRGAAASRAIAAAFAWLVGPTHAAAAPAAPSVWVIDDGEKIRRDATGTAFERGDGNPIWRPGQPARLFAMRQESVALQVVVEAGDAALADVSVELPELAGPGGARFDGRAMTGADAGAQAGSQAVPPVGRPIERFVEHFVTVRRASGGRTPGESLGWEAGSGPPPGAWVGAVPDALVPVEFAAPWVPYPLQVAPRSNGLVWIDVNVPIDAAAGTYRGAIDVRAGGATLASIPIELDVAPTVLPVRAGALLYADPDELRRRVGAGAEEYLWKLLHAHRIAPLHDAVRPEDVRRQRAALDGSLYVPSRGYAGCGQGVGDGVLSLGAYGGLGEPARAPLEALAAAVADARLGPAADVFLYADDEACASARGAAWRALVHASSDPRVRRVRVGWTCSDEPAGQPVDIPMVAAAAFDTASAARARAEGKDVWVYNGVLPRTGAFLIDVDAVSPRVNGWLAAMFGIRRWFYWEATYWYGRRGATPFDPFADAESFHNRDGDWADGDGVLVYPGRQADAFAEHSLGFDGVVPTIRLKNWRRGIEDAAYLDLAREKDPRAADAVANALIPAAFRVARGGAQPVFATRGQAFFDARRALAAIAKEAPHADPNDERGERDDHARGFAATAGDVGIAGVLIGVALTWVRARRRDPRDQRT